MHSWLVPRSNPAAARPEVEVFADLQSLCSSPGYIHAIAYFCWRDNLIRYTGSQVVEQDLEQQHSHNRLLRTEISILIGLMVQKAIDLSLPAPTVMQNYIERTEALLHELHHALTKPWFEEWDLKAGRLPEHDPFASAAGMREPIFYGSESAYSFQYRDFARLKYRADDEWFEANKGFRIEEACQVAEALGGLQLERQLECVQLSRIHQPDQWTMLPGFIFTTQDAVDASGMAKKRVEYILDAFSCKKTERNTSFTALNEFNVTNSTPILKAEDGIYILLQHYSLLEAIYETPFFWMAADKAYSSTALTNRGRFAEGLVAERLEAVFGVTRVFRNVDIYKGKSRLGEADALVLYGDRAIVVQAKSKRLTIGARKGNDLQLKDDFKKAIQNAYDQALLCAEALTNHGFRFVIPSGAEITISEKPRVVFPICIVSDHYPALAFQVGQFLNTTLTTSIQPPLVMDVFALDAFTEMLDTPLHFFNYLALRARFGEQLMVSQELVILGFHLKQNLWLDAECTAVTLGNEFTEAIDIAMQARRAGVPGERTPRSLSE